MILGGCSYSTKLALYEDLRYLPKDVRYWAEDLRYWKEPIYWKLAKSESSAEIEAAFKDWQTNRRRATQCLLGGTPYKIHDDPVPYIKPSVVRELYLAPGGQDLRREMIRAMYEIDLMEKVLAYDRPPPLRPISAPQLSPWVDRRYGLRHLHPEVKLEPLLRKKKYSFKVHAYDPSAKVRPVKRLRKYQVWWDTVASWHVNDKKNGKQLSGLTSIMATFVCGDLMMWCKLRPEDEGGSAIFVRVDRDMKNDVFLPIPPQKSQSQSKPSVREGR